MNITLTLFLFVVAITLLITGWAARRSSTTIQFWAAGRGIRGWQNGLAIAGDYMSAASFLGIAGLIAFNGYDGFMYSVGWLVAYLLVLFLVAEPMRNTGKFTMADTLAYRMRAVPVRSAAAVATIAVSAGYMMAQMVGAGSLVKILIPTLDATLKPYFAWSTSLGFKLDPSIAMVGVLMMIYVIAGGMVATTWVQIVKAVMLMGGAILLTLLVLIHFGFNIGSFFDHAAAVKDAKTQLPFTSPGILYKYGEKSVWGVDKALLENISLGMALVLGTAGLPHILMRFFTVPNAKAARTSVAWAMGLIGSFYVMTSFLGFGAASLVGKAHICAKPDAAGKCATAALNNNLSMPLLANTLGKEFFGTFGGEFLLALIAAVAFATILAVVAGLTLAAASAFSHDFYVNVIRAGHDVTEREQVRVARITAAAVGIVSIILASGTGATTNAAALVAGLAFVIAASANLPVILFTLFWKRFNTWGAVAGLLGGTLMAIWLYVIGPGFSVAPPKNPAFPLSNVGIVAIPFGFVCAVVFTWVGGLVKADRLAEERFHEIDVRAYTGLGAEPGTVEEPSVMPRTATRPQTSG
ncbi:MAG: cation acetate symporter [Chloroflexi bacterium]|nr:MAG: cation acetate symporter [Chloroflexota bacterium]TME14032.1 MAG: cation acetate symporter [Chloroflexota bacterium]TME19116.1 MAG: cation acetate symporter [Chloroflexota bacterium]